MISIVIPAYNEEQKIGRVIRGLFEHGWKNVVVVDDGSSDRTSAIARGEGAIVLQHRINRGQGAALETGDQYALRHGAEAVVHFDGDGQFNPTDIRPAIEAFQKSGRAVLFGSRFLDNRSQIPWLKRYVILPIARWIHFVFTGFLLSDAQNGFRILTRRALEQIRITEDGMAHNTEIQALVKDAGLTWLEWPVEVTYHEYGQGFLGGVKILEDLLFRALFK